MKGNVALTTVLVFSALFITTAVVIIYQAMDFASSTTSYTNQVYAQNAALTCLEESFYKISSDRSYGSSSTEFEIVFEENGDDKTKYCVANISSDGAESEVRRINVVSHYRNSSFSLAREIIDVRQENWQIN